MLLRTKQGEKKMIHFDFLTMMSKKLNLPYETTIGICINLTRKLISLEDLQKYGFVFTKEELAEVETDKIIEILSNKLKQKTNIINVDFAKIKKSGKLRR